MEITKEFAKQFAKQLIEAMFYDWSFDITIELHDDNCFYFQIGENNNQIEVHLKLKKDVDIIEVSVYKRSESFTIIGEYDLTENVFDRNSEFFEVMFSEHLID